MIPVRTLVRNMMATAKARTLPFRDASCRRGMLPGSSLSNKRRNSQRQGDAGESAAGA